MKTSLLLAAAMAVLTSAAAPAVAHAEKWYYYPVPGGAMGYDEDSRHADVASGNAVADVMIYYFVPRAAGPDAYSFVIMRMEFKCRGNDYQTLGAAYFDAEGGPLSQGEGGAWGPVKPGTPPAVFRRISCENSRPPVAKLAPDRAALIAAVKALPVTTALETTQADQTNATGKPATSAPQVIKSKPLPPKAAPEASGPTLSIEEFIAKSNATQAAVRADAASGAKAKTDGATSGGSTPSPEAVGLRKPTDPR